MGEETPEGTDECENGRMGSEKEMTQLSSERGGHDRWRKKKQPTVTDRRQRS